MQVIARQGVRKVANLQENERQLASLETPAKGLEVAVLIPCYNEAAAIGAVVREFRAAVPEARIFVYDNNSTDETAHIARAAGATVRSEPRQGKGHVVRRMFADVEADIYVMVDGDGTYDAKAAPAMIRAMVERGLDLVNGVRVAKSGSAYRLGHATGNRLLSGLVQILFGRGSKDMLSGYRVFSRRFVKTFPMMARGFEIETELTVHSLELGMPMGEVPGQFRERPGGDKSKLHPIRDGLRILSTIFRLLKQERPMIPFGGLAGLAALASVGLGAPVVAEYMASGLVPRLPTAILAASLMLVAGLGLSAGLILETVTRGRQEMKRMTYLSVAGVLARLEEGTPVASRRHRAG